MIEVNLTYAGSIAAILAAAFSFFLWRSERNHELSRLKALYQHLGFIEESAKEHEKHLKDKKLPDPSWPIANIDLNFYLTNIKYTTQKECCIWWVGTKGLKKELIAIFEKINNINYLWKLIIENSKIKSDLRTNTYYQDLYRFITSAMKEIEKIIQK
ncbi:MAG TPA: hypothetical protein VFE88_01395 [Candidatus Nanoarchaeia archaeon]|nr:hypothetical protein [Candidatus Nanoarchaeia archaeon]